MKVPHLHTEVDKYQQILLCNTNRNKKDYLKSIKLRYGGKYNKIPNYFVEKTGKVHNLSENDTTEYYLNGYRDSGVIVICLENLGWFKRRSVDGKFVDWLGDIYKGDMFEKKWRGKFFWDTYTDRQVEETINLINTLCADNDIPNECVGHNVLVDGVEHFKGIVSRSNYNEYWTDINPSFNFDKL